MSNNRKNKIFIQTKILLDKKKTSCVDIVESFLQNINENNHLNAFIEVFASEAREKAVEIDKKIKFSKAGKLAGMIVGIKDNILYKNHKSSAASKMLKNFISPYNSTVVKRLIDEDAIIIGRLNCDEFAMGSSNETSYFGKVLNPVNNKKVPGGSSGGAAAAVKAGLCHIALATDTGGSVRQPASFCGVIGLKPTYGRVSRYGCIAYASSCDQIGIIANNISDIAIALEIIAGRDDFDSTVSSLSVPEYSKFERLSYKEKKIKISYIKDCLNDKKLNSEIKNKFLKTIKSLKEKGFEIKEREFPLLKYLVPVYQIITSAEASSNLSRYNGVNYGFRSNDINDVDSLFTKSRTQGFGKEVKRKIMLGTFVLSLEYYEKYYEKAQKLRRMILDEIDKILSDSDYILLPTTPTPAFNIGEIKNPVVMYMQDIFTVLANLTGKPAISIPLYLNSCNMPFGMQIIADSFRENNLFEFSNFLLNDILNDK